MLECGLGCSVSANGPAASPHCSGSSPLPTAFLLPQCLGSRTGVTVPMLTWQGHYGQKECQGHQGPRPQCQGRHKGWPNNQRQCHFASIRNCSAPPAHLARTSPQPSMSGAASSRTRLERTSSTDALSMPKFKSRILAAIPPFTRKHAGQTGGKDPHPRPPGECRWD